MPKISIIVPFWNVECFFSQFLDSVLNQTFQDFELILVDDLSTDKSYQIAQAYQNQNSKILLFQNSYHSGSGGLGRQTGMDLASGEYVLFWDADDWVEKDTLEKLYACVVKQNADIVTFGYEQFSDGKIIPMSGEAWEECNSSGKKTLINFYVSQDHSQPFCLPMLCNKLIRRSLILEYKISHPTGRIRMQEIPFSVQCVIHAERVTYCPYVLYHWRLNNPSSITKSKDIPLLLTIYSTLLNTVRVIEEAGCMTQKINDSAFSLLWSSIFVIFIRTKLYRDSLFIQNFSIESKKMLLDYDKDFFSNHPSSLPIMQAWQKWIMVIDQPDTWDKFFRKYYFYFTIFKYQYIPFSFHDIMRKLFSILRI